MPTVAIVGAGPDRRKFANKAVRAFLAAGYEVFPVHPTATEVEGLPVYKTVFEIPRHSLDAVSVYLAPAVGLNALDDIATKSVGKLYLNPGADAPAVVAKATTLGLPVATECSILAVGFTPSQFPEE